MNNLLTPYDEIKCCGNCEHTDGICYTSNPPKVKCNITNKFHSYSDICDIWFDNQDNDNMCKGIVKVNDFDSLSEMIKILLASDHVIKIKTIRNEKITGKIESYEIYYSKVKTK